MYGGVSIALRIAAISIMPCAVNEFATGNVPAGVVGWMTAAFFMVIADTAWKR